MAFWLHGLLAMMRKTPLFHWIPYGRVADKWGKTAIWRYGHNARKPGQKLRLFMERS